METSKQEDRPDAMRRFFESDHLKDDLKRRAVRSASTRVVSQFLFSSMRIAAGLVLARLLAPDDFGLVAMVFALTMILQDIGTLGLGEAAVQSDKVTHEQLSCLFWMNAGMSVLVSVLFIAATPIVVWFYGEPRLQAIAIVMTSVFLFHGMSTQHLALLKRNMEFFKISVNEICAVVLSNVTAIVLALIGWGYWSIVMRRVLHYMSLAVGAWIFCGWKPGWHGTVRESRPLIRFGVNSLGSQVVAGLGKNFDKIVLGWRYSPQVLGFYDRAFQLFVMPFNQLTAPLTSVAVATLSRLRDDREKYCRYYLHALSVIGFVGMWISAVATITGRDVILFLLGEKWKDAGTTFMGFALGIGMMLICSTLSWVHISLGHAHRLFGWSVMIVVTTTSAILLSLPFGVVGVAVAYSLAFYVLLVPGVRYAGRPVGLRAAPVVAEIWRYFVAASVSGGACWYVFQVYEPVSSVYGEWNSFLRILAAASACTVGYVLLTIVLFRGPEPISKLLRMLGELRPRTRRS